MRIILSESNGDTLLHFRSDLVRDMIKAGHEVVCTSTDSDEEKKSDINKLGACYYCLSGKRKYNRITYYIRIFLNYIMVFKLNRPDLCLLSMPKASFLCCIAALFCRIRRITLLVTGPETVFYRKGFKEHLCRPFMKLLYRCLVNRCECVFFLNHDDYLRFRFWKLIRKEKAVILPGAGVNMEHYTFKPMPATDLVCMTAPMIRRKGVMEFIEAAEIVRKLYPQVRFLLVGNLSSGSEAVPESVIDEAAEKGVIYYCDYVKDIRPYLEVCSIFVLPSYHEGNLRSILEAEAVGRPIITTSAPGCREAVISGYNGFIVPPKDGRAIAEKIILLLENKDIKLNMSRKSYELCRNKFDIKKVNKIILDQLKLNENI